MQEKQGYSGAIQNRRIEHRSELYFLFFDVRSSFVGGAGDPFVGLGEEGMAMNMMWSFSY